MERVLADVSLSDPNVFAPAKYFTKLGDLVSVIVPNAFVLAGIIAFILLVLGGFGIIAGAGSGDTKRMEQGKKAITGAAIGLIIIIGSFWIIQIIQKLTGMTLLPTQ
jgi:Flp pilus assembly protein protease CpaA